MNGVRVTRRERFKTRSLAVGVIDNDSDYESYVPNLWRWVTSNETYDGEYNRAMIDVARIREDMIALLFTPEGIKNVLSRYRALKKWFAG